MVRIRCEYLGRTTYTEPMPLAVAIQTLAEFEDAGMVPEGAAYKIVDRKIAHDVSDLLSYALPMLVIVTLFLTAVTATHY